MDDLTVIAEVDLNHNQFLKADMSFQVGTLIGK